MTSKNLFFKLMREDAKRRLWIIALSVLTFFFTFPVRTALMISDYNNRMATDFDDIAVGQDHLNNILRSEFLGWTAPENGFMVFVMCMLAVLCAASGFSFLHSKKKVDFYHSLPIKREKLFAVPFIGGILFTAVPYVVFVIISGIVLQIKMGEMLSWAAVLSGFAVHMSFYLLIYATVTLAFILTGNTIVSLLGTLVFFILGPGSTGIIFAYYQEYFTTFYSNNEFWEQLFARLSPVSFYVMSIETDTAMALTVGIALAVALLLSVLAVVFYKRRPSEAAGRAMAFKKSQAVIKFLIVVPSALFGSLFMRQMGSGPGWVVFGLLCGLLLSYCVIEIIYNFDFRRLFSHRLQLALCTAVSLGTLAFFYFDLSGYDSYIPSADKIESSAVLSLKLDGNAVHDYRTKIFLEETTDGERHHFRMEYVEDKQLLKDMKLVDSAPVLAIAGIGVEETKTRGNDYRSYNMSLSAPMEYSGVTVKYVLKGGKEVYRRYFINYETLKEEFAAVYLQKEYKEAIYPILKEEAADIAGINYQEYSNFRHVNMPDSTMKEKLFHTYSEELMALSASVREEESPIGAIQFKTREVQEAIDTLKAEGDDYEYLRFNEYYYYPIYPSFTKTIALLDECGIEAGTFLNSEKVEKIELVGRARGSREMSGGSVSAAEAQSVYEDKRQSMIVRDKSEIEQILKASVSADIYDNRLNEVNDGIDVTVFVPYEKLNTYGKKTGEDGGEMYADDMKGRYNSQSSDASDGDSQEEKTFNIYLDQDKVPAFVGEELNASFD